MKLSILSSLALFLVSIQISSVLAIPASADIISPNEIRIKSSRGLRLISLSEDAKPVWKSEDEVLELIKSDTGFMDVTETYSQNLEIEQKLAAQRKAGGDVSIQATWPPVTQQTKVNGIINLLSTSQMSSYLSTLTSFNNRYYKSSTGASASNSIYSTLSSVTSGKSYITVSQFTHSFVQKSVIVKFAGTGTGPITILGCHLDSINQSNPTSGRAPGADDNGTGCVNLMDTIRSIVSYGYTPKTPLEFHL
ncbi:hypothetical protein FRC02_008266 [Tulasnella sp. 418]|nr:hypothetical protein FRC02_008266 [Tulasnella sp. 418]